MLTKNQYLSAHQGMASGFPTTMHQTFPNAHTASPLPLLFRPFSVSSCPRFFPIPFSPPTLCLHRPFSDCPSNLRVRSVRCFAASPGPPPPERDSSSSAGLRVMALTCALSSVLKSE
ncbi:uncharacterized protein LOC131158782 isoform X5 [Malania oleifera]|uniref:uncharacterized protein LOC131158782 isoform X5 n=1 Tax=Malania oleifera TaxID=397392 RepID=UPI0025AE064C|nr:uncharacterized protein LOC131158782 isoform X5 [Malania oleifera]